MGCPETDSLFCGWLWENALCDACLPPASNTEINVQGIALKEPSQRRQETPSSPGPLQKRQQFQLKYSGIIEYCNKSGGLESYSLAIPAVLRGFARENPKIDFPTNTPKLRAAANE